MQQTSLNIEAATRPPRKPAIALTGRATTLTVLRLLDGDLGLIAADLDSHLARNPDFFRNAPVVLDLQAVADGVVPPLAELLLLLRQRQLLPVAVQGATPERRDEALSLGLPELSAGGERPSAVAETAVARVPAKVVMQPVRSGQQVYARGGDLVVFGTVNPGAEVLADGSIHIYGHLHGKALAGVQGDTTAAIYCSGFGAELVAVAGIYRAAEELSDAVCGGPARVALSGERLVVEAAR